MESMELHGIPWTPWNSMDAMGFHGFHGFVGAPWDPWNRHPRGVLDLPRGDVEGATGPRIAPAPQDLAVRAPRPRISAA